MHVIQPTSSRSVARGAYLHGGDIVAWHNGLCKSHQQPEGLFFRAAERGQEKANDEI